MKTKKKEFYRDPNDGYYKCVNASTKRAYARIGETFDVIQIPFCNKKNRYLYLKSSKAVQPLITYLSPSYNYDEKGNSVLSKMFECNKFKFKRKDLSVINLMIQNKHNLTRVIYCIFQCYYNVSCTLDMDEETTTYFSDNNDRTTQKYVVSAENLFTYSSKLVQFLFLLVNHAKLDVLTINKVPELNIPDIFENWDDIDPKTAAVTLSDTISQLVTNNDFKPLFIRLIKLMVFDFSSTVQTVLDIVDFLPILTAINSFVNYSMIFKHKTRVSSFFSGEDLDTQWSWFNSTYAKCITERNLAVQAAASYFDHKTDTVVHKGKYFNREYVHFFVKECRATYDDCKHKLGNFFEIPTVASVGTKLLDCDNIRPDDPYSVKSLLDVFPLEVLRPLNYRFLRNPENMEETQGLIQRMGACLMWLAFVDIYPSIEFSEIQNWTYSGNKRNIFYDIQERSLRINIYHSENGSLAVKGAMLTRSTSAYLLHYLLPIRQLLYNINTLNDQIETANFYSSTVLGDFFSNDEKSADFSDFATDTKPTVRHILYRFVWVDSTNLNLIYSDKFYGVAKSYPSNIHNFMKLSFDEWRYSLIVLGKGIIETEEILRNQKKSDDFDRYLNHSVSRSQTDIFHTDQSISLSSDFSKQLGINKQWHIALKLPSIFEE